MNVFLQALAEFLSLSNQCSQYQFHKKKNGIGFSDHIQVSLPIFSCIAEACSSYAHISFTMNEAAFVPFMFFMLAMLL